MYKKDATITITKKRYCFRKGYLQISLTNKEALRSDLIVVLGNPSRHYFSRKLNNGIIDISVTLYDAINEVFGKYGISDIWDITEIN